MLEGMVQWDLLPVEMSSQSSVTEIQKIKDIASSIALRKLKQEQDVKQILERGMRLPPTPEATRNYLRQQLADIWGALDPAVVDKLVRSRPIEWCKSTSSC